MRFSYSASKRYHDRFLVPLLALLLALGVATASQAQVQPQVIRTADAAVRGFTENDFPRVHRIREHLYVLEDLAGPIDSNLAFTTNCFIIITEEGVVIVDGLHNDERTALLVEEVRKLTDQPIRYVIIGADHGDHIAGNNAFPEDVIYIAHPRTIAMIAANARLPVPQEAVADSRTLILGGVEMEIMHLGRAHTGTDLVVYLPQDDVLWASETWFNRLYPSVGGQMTAVPTEWLAVLQRIDAMNVGLNLPNHGFIDTPEILAEEFRNFMRALENLIEEGRAMYERGISAQRAPRLMNLGEFAYWYRAPNNLPDAVLQLYRELDGELVLDE